MKRVQWKSLLLGAATFVVTHLVVVRTWAMWFDGQREPWFLNSGRAVWFTAMTRVCSILRRLPIVSARAIRPMHRCCI